MNIEGLPLQVNMFSGELVDARSDYQKKKDRERTAPQQMQMFKTPEMVQVGRTIKSAYQDWLDQTAAPPLVLQMVETRTPEEIEQDRIREAQALTRPLFDDPKPPEPTLASPAPTVDLIVSPPGIETDTTVVDDEADDEAELPLPASRPVSKLSVYMQLVELAYERESTLTASKPMLLSQQIAAGVLTCEARMAGLTTEEMQLAETIGMYRAKAKKRESEVSTTPVLTQPVISFPQTGVVWMKTTPSWLEMSRL